MNSGNVPRLDDTSINDAPGNRYANTLGTVFTMIGFALLALAMDAPWSSDIRDTNNANGGR